MSDRPAFLSRLALPVAWEALGRAPLPEDCERAARANAGVLAFLLHGVDLEAAQRPADERLTEALAPLRMKLDIVIEMLSRLTYRDVEVPPVREIELRIDRMAWESPQALLPGDWLRIKLFFDPKFLEPIIRYGSVTSAVKDEATGSCSVQAEFIEISEEAE